VHICDTRRQHEAYPRAQDVIQSRPVTSFEQADDESKTKQGRVRLGTSEGKGENGPTDLLKRYPDCKYVSIAMLLSASSLPWAGTRVKMKFDG
jgi:hypothetical protein